jgi:hypothetical protein
MVLLSVLLLLRGPGQGTERTSGCRFERRAARMPPFTTEGSPSIAADRWSSRPGDQTAEDTRCSTVELRPARCPGGETRTPNLPMNGSKEPPPAHQADSAAEHRRELRGHDSNADLLVQSQAWCRLHGVPSESERSGGETRDYLASVVWTGRVELPTPGSQGRCAAKLRHVQRAAPQCGYLGAISPREVPTLRRCACVLVPEARVSGLWPERLFEAGVFRNSVLTVGFEPTLAAV